ncbi:hypothetical protein ABZ690_00835 [Streptomyces sp. NPDC006967]|uniref:hypothetical protein n=1 Tax=Streptomyces sp. NPDC006967 TaxID=3156906 RepID=UPI0033FF9C34
MTHATLTEPAAFEPLAGIASADAAHTNEDVARTRRYLTVEQAEHMSSVADQLAEEQAAAEQARRSVDSYMRQEHPEIAKFLREERLRDAVHTATKRTLPEHYTPELADAIAADLSARLTPEPPAVGKWEAAALDTPSDRTFSRALDCIEAAVQASGDVDRTRRGLHGAVDCYADEAQGPGQDGATR